MNIKSIFTLLLLLTPILFAGCYTKLGYYEAENLKKQTGDSHVEKTEKAIADASEGYYGRRKPTYRNARTYVGDPYWVPYTSHSYPYYPPYVSSYYYPWYYGYYPYRSYSPYRGYYGRYHGSSVYHISRGTQKNRGVLQSHRRAQYTRSVTSRNSLSRRSQAKRR